MGYIKISIRIPKNQYTISTVLIICNKLSLNSNIKSIILCHVDGWHIIRQQERR
ncbi:hypothetical protein BACPEC_02226 [[Bacteroides] pectinophilus ATCC 43243]|uniref:Uncharacterized protein n=1 Tax=[Bacteroides] pectinophilus ATCC 43243 TaxID=483218 RepID=B7AU38_9FIRM|nr:hypothetical protein BACPEC_02226 [[Bacteroides] pectinophilus ATCC 43243]